MRFLILLLFLLQYEIAGAQSPNWHWAKQSNCTGGVSMVTSVSSDHNGSVYLTGYFSAATITFGTFTLTNADNSGNTNDIFIVKYDVSGNVLWAKSFGDVRDDKANSISSDAVGNFYITGSFGSHTITFGTFTLINSSNAPGLVFIVKCNSAGNVIWAKKNGPAGSLNQGLSVSADPLLGNVYVTGDFEATTLSFGTLSVSNSNLGSSDFFIVKYDSSGNAVWLRSASGNSDDHGTSVSADALGNVFVSGYFSSPSIAFGTLIFTTSFTRDVFIVKYNSSGTVIWGHSAVLGNSGPYESAVSADNTGNVYMTGGFSDPNINFGNYTFTNIGGNDYFLVKYDTYGSVVWAMSSGGTGDDRGFSVASDAIGNVVVAGRFTGDSIVLGTNTLYFPTDTIPDSVQSNTPMFIAKYNSFNEATVCASALADGGGWQGGVSLDEIGNAYLVGNATNNPFPIGSDTLTGSPIVFLAKWSCPGDLGVNDLKNNIEIKIFPNPSPDIFNIECSEEIQAVTVCDLLGNEIHKVNSSQRSIDLSSFSQGIYFLKVKTLKGDCVKKIIKE